MSDCVHDVITMREHVTANKLLILLGIFVFSFGVVEHVKAQQIVFERGASFISGVVLNTTPFS